MRALLSTPGRRSIKRLKHSRPYESSWHPPRNRDRGLCCGVLGGTVPPATNALGEGSHAGVGNLCLLPNDVNGVRKNRLFLQPLCLTGRKHSQRGSPALPSAFACFSRRGPP